MNNKIHDAIDSAQHAQRNYDLTKTIPKHDLDTLIYAAANSPSKQNETHYSLRVYTDQNIIKQVYKQTKKFTVHLDDDFSERYDTRNGEFWQDEDRSVYNSQILANALFVWVDDCDNLRGGEHILAQDDNVCAPAFNEQKNYSIGISAGELILTAAMLGYKSGLCGGYNRPQVAKIVNADSEVKLLAGVGFNNPHIDRQLHSEMLNSDLPEPIRNGPLNEKWRFPSFNKECKVFLNDSSYY